MTAGEASGCAWATWAATGVWARVPGGPRAVYEIPEDFQERRQGASSWDERTIPEQRQRQCEGDRADPRRADRAPALGRSGLRAAPFPACRPGLPENVPVGGQSVLAVRPHGRCGVNEAAEALGSSPEKNLKAHKGCRRSASARRRRARPKEGGAPSCGATSPRAATLWAAGLHGRPRDADRRRSPGFSTGSDLWPQAQWAPLAKGEETLPLVGGADGIGRPYDGCRWRGHGFLWGSGTDCGNGSSGWRGWRGRDGDARN